MIIPISSAKGTKISKNEPKSSAKTPKYSSIFILVPMGSLILISPEKIKRPPTKNLET
jgi:hypothetical protein